MKTFAINAISRNNTPARSLRLAVRTLPSHGENRDSNSLGSAEMKNTHSVFFISVHFLVGITVTLLISCYDSFLAIMISGFFAFVGCRFYHAGRILFETNNLIIKKFCDCYAR